MQFFRQRHQIDGVLRFSERNHLLEDVPVLREEEILGFQRFNGGVQCVVVEQNRAEDGALGIEIIRKGAFENGIDRHLCS